MGAVFSREVQIAVACAAPWADGVFELDPSPRALDHPDVLGLAIVLSPYDVNELVRTHAAVMDAIGERAIAGRILYVDAAARPPVPLLAARRILPTPEERAVAQRRVHLRRRHRELEELRVAFLRIAEAALPSASPGPLPPGAMRSGAGAYRTSSGFAIPIPRPRGAAVSVSLREGAGLEVHADPFPQRRRVLVIDEAPLPPGLRSELDDCELVAVADGWTAIERATSEDFALVICAVRVGEMTAKQLYRMAVAARPELASRFAFLAGPIAVAGAPPSSTRALARPLAAHAIRGLLAAM